MAIIRIFTGPVGQSHFEEMRAGVHHYNDEVGDRALADGRFSSVTRTGLPALV